MKDPVSARSKIYRLSLDALFVALYVVLGTFLSFKIPGTIQFSISTFPILLCAFLFTPADAAIVALLGTFLEQIIDPSPYGFVTLPMWLIPGVVMALIASFGAMGIKRIHRHIPVMIAACVVIVLAELTLTLLNIAALYIDGYILGYPVKALTLLLPARLLNCLVRCVLSSALIVFLVPPLRRILKKMQIAS